MSALSLDILGPALVAGLLILATHVPLGAMALDRASALTGLAVTQAAALGIIVGSAMLTEFGGWAVQIFAVVVALGFAMVLNWASRRFQAAREAIVALVYVAAAALMLLPYASHEPEQLAGLLVGQVFLVSPTQLLVMAVIYAGVMAAWYFRSLVEERVFFSAMLAVAVTASVQVVGVFPAFAMLIIPAVAASRASARWRLVIGFNIGVVGYLAGLVALALWNGLTGAVFIGSLAVAGLIGAALVAARQKGAVVDAADMANVRSLQEEIQARMTKTKVA